MGSPSPTSPSTAYRSPASELLRRQRRAVALPLGKPPPRLGEAALAEAEHSHRSDLVDPGFAGIVSAQRLRVVPEGAVAHAEPPGAAVLRHVGIGDAVQARLVGDPYRVALDDHVEALGPRVAAGGGAAVRVGPRVARPAPGPARGGGHA